MEDSTETDEDLKVPCRVRLGGGGEGGPKARDRVAGTGQIPDWTLVFTHSYYWGSLYLQGEGMSGITCTWSL